MDEQTALDFNIDRALQRAIGLGEELTPAQKQAILEQRARALAQPINEVQERSRDTLRVLTFRINNESYAFPAASVFSVSKSIPITPVPCVPSFVAGITNLRGHIRSVVHLAQFLGYDELQPDHNHKDEYVIVAQHGDMEVAFIVSALEEVTDLLVNDIKPRPLAQGGKASQYIAGVVPGGLILLDLQMIFADERFVIHDEVF